MEILPENTLNGNIIRKYIEWEYIMLKRTRNSNSSSLQKESQINVIFIAIIVSMMFFAIIILKGKQIPI